MLEFDGTVKTKIAELRTIVLSGQQTEVYEAVRIDWPSPTGSIWYSVMQLDEVLDVPPPVSPLETRLIPEEDDSWFLPVNLDSTVGDEEVELRFYDGDGAMSDLIHAHGEGVKVELFYWFPQVELLHSLWHGHLRQDDEATPTEIPLKAVQGFRAAESNVPDRAHYHECQNTFGGVFETQGQIDEGGCNYNKHIGGGVGINNPATGQPWTYCDRRTSSSCIARGIDPNRHLSHATVTASVVNNQTSGPRLISQSQGNESYLTEPVRVIMGNRRIYGMPLLAFRRDHNNNHPEDGWFSGVYEACEGPINSISNAIVHCGGESKPVQLQHYAYRLGTIPQTPAQPTVSNWGYPGTAHIWYHFGWIDPAEVDPSGCSAEAHIGGLNNLRVYTDENTFTKTWTSNRVWQLLEILTNKRWGYGYDHSRFDIPSWIDAATWSAQSVTFTDFTGKAWTHIRGDSHVELVSRKVQQQIEDICTAGRLSLPFLFNGKIHIVPLRKATPEELAAAPVFTDEGDTPNIIWEELESGVLQSTLTVQVTSTIDLVNRVECSFDDSANAYQKRPLQPLEDIDLQLAAGRVVGDSTRRKNPKQYSLLGVVNEAQAMKIGWSLLDLGPLDRGGKENNLKLRFRLWFADAIDLHPWKIIKVESDRLTRYGFKYFRIMSIKRLDNLEYEIEAQAYNETYMAAFETTAVSPPPLPGPGENPGPGTPPSPCRMDFGQVIYDGAALEIPIEPCLGIVQPDTEPPSQPIVLSMAADDHEKITLTWAAATDNVAVTGYEVRIKEDGGAYGAWTDAGNVLTYQFTGLDSDTLHKAQVRAYDAAGNDSDPSAEASATTTAIDLDALAFLTATGITDPTISAAIDGLVLTLKDDGIWSKLPAIYPFVGGTAGTHKFNLKDPQDTNGAFRLTFTGGWTHSATGALPNGSTGYADTHFNQSTDGAEDDEFIGVYLRTNSATTGCDVGVADGTAGTQLFSRTASDQFTTRSQRSTTDTVANSDSRGWFAVSRTSGSEYRKQKNGTVSTVTANSDKAPINASFYLGARNVTGTATTFSDREIAFAAIGQGLSQTEMEDLYTAVQAFQTALSREV